MNKNYWRLAAKMISKKYFSAISLLFLFLIGTSLHAQGSEDFLRSTGKIYVVVAVIVITFLGIVAYLFYIDRKLNKLEEQINNE